MKTKYTFEVGNSRIGYGNYKLLELNFKEHGSSHSALKRDKSLLI